MSQLYRHLRILISMLVFVAADGSAISAEIPGSCMASFNVKDKTFSTATATVSCTQAERRRLDLFQEITKLPSTGAISATDVGDKLAKWEAEFKQQEEANNWTGWSLALSGNFLSTLGLAACFDGGPVGCALAAIGKALSVAGIIDTGTSEADKKANSAKLRTEIANYRAYIQGKTPASDLLKARLVNEATDLCFAVKKSCL